MNRWMNCVHHDTQREVLNEWVRRDCRTAVKPDIKGSQCINSPEHLPTNGYIFLLLENNCHLIRSDQFSSGSCFWLCDTIFNTDVMAVGLVSYHRIIIITSSDRLRRSFVPRAIQLYNSTQNGKGRVCCLSIMNMDCHFKNICLSMTQSTQYLTFEDLTVEKLHNNFC